MSSEPVGRLFAIACCLVPFVAHADVFTTASASADISVRNPPNPPLELHTSTPGLTILHDASNVVAAYANVSVDTFAHNGFIGVDTRASCSAANGYIGSGSCFSSGGIEFTDNLMFYGGTGDAVADITYSLHSYSQEIASGNAQAGGQSVNNCTNNPFCEGGSLTFVSHYAFQFGEYVHLSMSAGASSYSIPGAPAASAGAGAGVSEIVIRDRDGKIFDPGTLLTYSSSSGTVYQVTNAEYVPEPATAVLAAPVLLVMLRWRRRARTPER